jgi:hypothetical protein
MMYFANTVLILMVLITLFATLSMAAPIYRMELHYQPIKQTLPDHLSTVRQSMHQENTAIANYLDPDIWPENAYEAKSNIFSDVLKQIRRLPYQLLAPPADIKERFARNSRDELGYAEWLVEITL